MKLFTYTDRAGERKVQSIADLEFRRLSNDGKHESEKTAVLK
jgi:hypothetical protein